MCQVRELLQVTQLTVPFVLLRARQGVLGTVLWKWAEVGPHRFLLLSTKTTVKILDTYIGLQRPLSRVSLLTAIEPPCPGSLVSSLVVHVTTWIWLPPVSKMMWQSKAERALGFIHKKRFHKMNNLSVFQSNSFL